ncbi:MAG: hypothetical protein ACK4ND_19415, partial [Cytophagaceae bacterium]
MKVLCFDYIFGLLDWLKRKVINTFFIHLLLFSFFFQYNAFSEGTRELRPTQADHGYLQVHDPSAGTNRPFMSFEDLENSRLNVRICNIGEKVFMGFRMWRTNSLLYFRVKDPNGNTIPLPGMVSHPTYANTYEVPRPVASNNNTLGYISTYNRCIEGPRQIVGGFNGYLAIEFTPTMTGDYYIEFNANDPINVVREKHAFREFDITVTTAANVPILGRLWSKNWDVNLEGWTNEFKAIIYVYAKDSIVTSVNFNGMQPYSFNIAANSTGLFDTGDADFDRMSRIGNYSRPEYKLFLNDPDPACFPSGSFGSLTQPTTVTGCDPNNRCINVYSDKVGDVEILLDLNGIEGYQTGTIDRIIRSTVVPGHNCITWDSRDGLGNYIPPGDNINLQVDYYNGLTHLALYDVEQHRNGYIIELVRPFPTTGIVRPALFWDDSQITAGTADDGLVNLTGCDNGAAVGCHRWRNRGDNSCPWRNGIRECPETINTWWYAQVIRDVAEYNLPDIYVNANTNNPPGTRHDTTVCANTPPIQLNGGVTGGLTSTGVWSGAGTFV